MPIGYQFPYQHLDHLQFHHMEPNHLEFNPYEHSEAHQLDHSEPHRIEHSESQHFGHAEPQQYGHSEPYHFEHSETQHNEHPYDFQHPGSHHSDFHQSDHPIDPGYNLIYDHRIDFPQAFSPDNYLPIEINVPDTFMSFWQNIGSAWDAASGYFSMGNQVTPR